MEQLAWRERPSTAVLTVGGCLAFVGLISQVLLVIAASAFARLEKDGDHRLFLAPTVVFRAQMQKVERHSPLLTAMVKAAPTRFAVDTVWGRDLDRRSLAEFYWMFFLGLLVWCLLQIANYVLQVCIHWRLLKAGLSRIQAQQGLDRPEGSTYPKSAEWLLYASAWEEYCVASELAEALRDHYEVDWEPKMGRYRANCRYIHEVIRILPQTHKATGERFERRTATN